LVTLAILAARPMTSLERAFTAAPRQDRLPPNDRKPSKADLFAIIRRDAQQSGRSVRALADRHGVHRRTVQQALASPNPPPRKRLPAGPSRLDPFKDTINTLLRHELDNPDQPARSIKEIFDLLVAEHDATQISYSMVRTYIAARRGLRPRPRSTTVQTVAPATTSQPSPPPAHKSHATTTWSPAHLAVEHLDLPRLRELLDSGHDVEDDNGDGWTLLRHSIDSEYDAHTQSGQSLHADITAFLLARGAAPLRTHDGIPVVVEAEIRGHWLAAEIMRAWIGRDQQPPPSP
jgi:uncharacterized protein